MVSKSKIVQPQKLVASVDEVGTFEELKMTRRWGYGRLEDEVM